MDFHKTKVIMICCNKLKMTIVFFINIEAKFQVLLSYFHLSFSEERVIAIARLQLLTKVTFQIEFLNRVVLRIAIER